MRTCVEYLFFHENHSQISTWLFKFAFRRAVTPSCFQGSDDLWLFISLCNNWVATRRWSFFIGGWPRCWYLCQEGFNRLDLPYSLDLISQAVLPVRWQLCLSPPLGWAPEEKYICVVCMPQCKMNPAQHIGGLQIAFCQTDTSRTLVKIRYLSLQFDCVRNWISQNPNTNFKMSWWSTLLTLGVC